MPKVGASMANVKTTFVPVEPDLYLVTLEKPGYSVKEGRATYTVQSKIISGEETGAQNAGRVIFDNISMHKKTGETNDVGEAQLKRYIEAAFPESKEWSEEQWEDFDTDELAGHQVQLNVIIEPDKNDPEVKYNRVKKVLSV
jgi:hypothetical protein